MASAFVGGVTSVFSDPANLPYQIPVTTFVVASYFAGLVWVNRGNSASILRTLTSKWRMGVITVALVAAGFAVVFLAMSYGTETLVKL